MFTIVTILVFSNYLILSTQVSTSGQSSIDRKTNTTTPETTLEYDWTANLNISTTTCVDAVRSRFSDTEFVELRCGALKLFRIGLGHEFNCSQHDFEVLEDEICQKEETNNLNPTRAAAHTVKFSKVGKGNTANTTDNGKKVDTANKTSETATKAGNDENDETVNKTRNVETVRKTGNQENGEIDDQNGNNKTTSKFDNGGNDETANKKGENDDTANKTWNSETVHKTDTADTNGNGASVNKTNNDETANEIGNGENGDTNNKTNSSDKKNKTIISNSDEKQNIITNKTKAKSTLFVDTMNFVLQNCPDGSQLEEESRLYLSRCSHLSDQQRDKDKICHAIEYTFQKASFNCQFNEQLNS